MRRTGRTLFLLLIACAGLGLGACGGLTAGPKKAGTAADKDNIEANISYMETAAPPLFKPSQKKVPMPQVEAKFDFAFPEVKEKKLKNGLRIFHVHHARLPLVTVELVFRAGSAYDPAGLQGLAVFAGEMLKGGTETRTSKEVAEAFEMLGTSLHVWTDYDATILQVTCLREHFDQVLELLADVSARPTFPEDEIENLRARELGRLTLSKSDPGWLATREFAAQVYGGHPYGRYDATEESIGSIKKKDIESFHGRAYCGANGFLTVVGDVTFDEAAKKAASHLGALPSGKALKMKKAKISAVDKTRIVIVDRPGSVQTLFKAGAAALKRKDPDFVPLEVADYILGGSPSSRLFLRVREKESNAYSIGSRLTETLDRGTWYVSGSTSTEATGEALASTLDEINRIVSEDASPDEMKDALAFMTGSFALRIETTDQVAAHVSDLALFGLAPDYWDTYFHTLAEVQAQGVREKAAAVLDPNRLVVVLVGDAGKIKPLVANYDNITIVNP